MASRNSRILQAGDYAIAAKNYADYIERRLKQSTTKRGQAGIPSTKPKSLPRQKVAVRPYGLEVAGNGFKVVTASKKAYEKLKPELGARVSEDGAVKKGGDSSRGFNPAKVTLFIPDTKSGTGATYVKSEKTKLNYIKYPGTSYTSPHGATSDKEEYGAGVSAVRAALETKYVGYEHLRISFQNERF